MRILQKLKFMKPLDFSGPANSHFPDLATRVDFLVCALSCSEG